VHALDGLADLHLVAEEDEVAGSGAGGDEVGEGHLAGFVDEEVAERAFERGFGKSRRCRRGAASARQPRTSATLSIGAGERCSEPVMPPPLQPSQFAPLASPLP
jgi:hypothetical protein